MLKSPLREYVKVPSKENMLKSPLTDQDLFPDVEIEQAIARLLLATVLFSLILPGKFWGDVSYIEPITLPTSLYLIFALSWLGISRLQLFPTPVRRIIAAFLDNILIANSFYSGGEIAGLIVCLPIFVTMDYGLRFGTGYAVLSMISGSTSLEIGLFNSPYWHAHALISIGIILGLILFPIYIIYLASHMKKAHLAAEARATKFEQISNTDSLTDVLNRRGFETAFMQSLNAKEMGFLMFIDIDNFKQINDQYGHKAGDEYLRQVSKVLTDCIRHSDTLGRLGGDEFAVFFPHASEKHVRKISQRILGELIHLAEVNFAEIEVSASIGVCAYNGAQNPSVMELVEMADHYMYQAKYEGKGRISISGKLI